MICMNSDYCISADLMGVNGSNICGIATSVRNRNFAVGRTDCCVNGVRDKERRCCSARVFPGVTNRVGYRLIMACRSSGNGTGRGEVPFAIRIRRVVI